MTDATMPSRRAIMLLAGAGFASMASMRVCDALLPELARAFDTSTAHAAQTITAFVAAYGVLQLFYGPLGDRYGKYRVISLAALACVIGSVGAALATSLPALIFFRAVVGATTAGIIPLSMAWIGDTVPYEHRQATLANMLSGTLLGLIIGQFMGGVFADTLGWRWSFAVLAAVYLAVGLLLRAELRVNADSHARLSPGVKAAGGITYFGRVLTVLRNPWARTVLAIAFVEALALFGAVALIPAYLHLRFGISLTAAGAIAALIGIGGLLYIVRARMLVTALGERGLAWGGGAMLCGGFMLLAWGPAWYAAMPAALVTGFGYYMLHNTLQTNATQMAPAMRGTAVSLFACFLFTGQSVGVALASAVMEYAGAHWVMGGAALMLLATGAVFSRVMAHRPDIGAG